jgi:hypothetical protein
VAKIKPSKTKTKFRGQTVMATAYDSDDEEEEDGPVGKLKRMEQVVNEEDMMMMLEGEGEGEGEEKEELEVTIGKKKKADGKEGKEDTEAEEVGEGGDARGKKRRREKGGKKKEGELSKAEEKHFDKELKAINKFIEEKEAAGGMKSSINKHKKAKVDQ